MSEPRLCIVCGARVENLNPATNVCDSICRQARDNGVSRAGQLRIEMAFDRAKERNDDYLTRRAEFHRRNQQ